MFQSHALWLQDPVLIDRVLAEKLEREADAVRAEGWKWTEVAIDADRVGSRPCTRRNTRNVRLLWM